MYLAIQAMMNDACKETLDNEFLRMIKTMHEEGYTLYQMRALYKNRAKEEIQAVLK